MSKALAIVTALTLAACAASTQKRDDRTSAPPTEADRSAAAPKNGADRDGVDPGSGETAATDASIPRLLAHYRCPVCHVFLKEPDYLKSPDHAASLLASVESKNMPVGGPRVAEADQKLLRTWKDLVDRCPATRDAADCR